jgi:hypothetical protein
MRLRFIYTTRFVFLRKVHEVVVLDRKTTTQFSIAIDVKNSLDKFKANHKERILKDLRKSRRLVTNSDAVRFLLSNQKKQ